MLHLPHAESEVANTSLEIMFAGGDVVTLSGSLDPQAAALQERQQRAAYLVTQLKGGLNALQATYITINNNNLKLQAVLAASKLNASMAQLEATALKKSKDGLSAGIDKLQDQESKLVADASEAAAKARTYIQTRMTLLAQRDTALQRIAEMEVERNESNTRATRISEDIKALERQLGQAQAELAAAVKVYADREGDLKKLVSDADSQRNQVTSELQKLLDTRAQLTTKVNDLLTSITQLTSRRSALQLSVETLQKAIAESSAELVTRTAEAEMAEKQVETYRSVARAGAAKAATLTEERRSKELKLYDLQAEQARLTTRSQELTKVIATLQREVADSTTLSGMLGKRVQDLQDGISSLRASTSSLQPAIAALNTQIGATRNQSAAVVASKSAHNNATIDMLVEASELRRTYGRLNADIVVLRQTAEKAELEHAKRGVSAAAPGISDEVLASLGLLDDHIDPESALQEAVHVGPTDEEIDVALENSLGSLVPVSQPDPASAAMTDRIGDDGGASSSAMRFRQTMLQPQPQSQQRVAPARARSSLQRFAAVTQLDADASSGMVATVAAGGVRAGMGTGWSNPATAALAAQVSVLETQLNDLQSQVTAQEAKNKAASDALASLQTDIDATIERARKSTEDKLGLATTVLDSKDRFDSLRDRVTNMRDTFYNSSDAIDLVRDEIEELKFNAAQVAAREKAVKDRLTASNDEVTQTETKRRELVGSIAKAADDKISQTQALKASVANLVVQRRTIAQDIASKTGVRLIAAQQVDYLQQQVTALTAQQNELTGSIADLSGQVDKLQRTKDVTSDELTLAITRAGKAQASMPAALQQKDASEAVLKNLVAQVEGFKTSLIDAETAVHTAQANVDSLTSQRAAVNAHIAELKIAVSTSKQAIVDLSESKAQAEIEFDRLEDTQQKQQLEATRLAQQLEREKAALERAVSRQARAADGLANLRRQVQTANSVQLSLRATLGLPAPSNVTAGQPRNGTSTSQPVAGTGAAAGPTSSPPPAQASGIQQQLAGLRFALQDRAEKRAELGG